MMNLEARAFVARVCEPHNITQVDDLFLVHHGSFAYSSSLAFLFLLLSLVRHRTLEAAIFRSATFSAGVVLSPFAQLTTHNAPAGASVFQQGDSVSFHVVGRGVW